MQYFENVDNRRTQPRPLLEFKKTGERTMDRLDALKVFCAVVEAGGFSKAADRLGISTSSVTNQIGALETHFKARLLNRTTRSMSLTDEGRHCHEHALRLLADMDELESHLQHASQAPRGGLRVDMPGLISREIVAPALPQFLAAYPDITLRLTASDRLVDMVEEGIDVLLRIGALQNSNLIARPVLRTRYVCCAAPAFLERHGRPRRPEDLAGFACLNFLYPKSRLVRPWLFQHDGKVFSHTPQGRVATDHIDSLVGAACAGAGIVQALSVSVSAHLASGALLPLLVDYAAPGPDVSVLYQQKHHRAAKVGVFVDFLEHLFQKV
jgi:LysR family transcriptional regulator for bpeEF and oprC